MFIRSLDERDPGRLRDTRRIRERKRQDRAGAVHAPDWPHEAIDAVGYGHVDRVAPLDQLHHCLGIYADFASIRLTPQAQPLDVAMRVMALGFGIHIDDVVSAHPAFDAISNGEGSWR